MRYKLIAVTLAIVCVTGCTMKQEAAAPTSSPAPTPPPASTKAGGIVSMGRSVQTQAGDVVTTYSWRRGANRSIQPGPGQVYETVDIGFCAGAQVEESASELATLVSLQLPSSQMVGPDSMSAKGEFRSKGTIHPTQCVRGPLVFQVSGGAKPNFVVFNSSPAATKWRVV
jgi:hypothetical protein